MEMRQRRVGLDGDQFGAADRLKMTNVVTQFFHILGREVEKLHRHQTRLRANDFALYPNPAFVLIHRQAQFDEASRREWLASKDGDRLFTDINRSCSSHVLAHAIDHIERYFPARRTAPFVKWPKSRPRQRPSASIQ